MAGVIVGLWVGFLLILLKLGVVKKWHLWMTVSPVVVLIVVLCILALPMTWGAPAGPVTVYQYVTRIEPAVSGLVEEIMVKSLVPIKQGETLFRIDSDKYQAEVNRLEAALAEAKQNVLQLEAAFKAAESSYAQAVAVRDRAKLNFDKAAALRKSSPGALAGIQVDQAELSLAETNAGVDTAQANKEKARLAFKSEINGESTAVVQFRAQLESARFDLANCDVKAPVDGFVPGILLQKGQYLSIGEGVMAFVQANRADLLALIAQNAVRDIKIGQPAEIVLDMYPGRTFSGTVVHILQLTPEGQITANEAIMVALPEGEQTESIVEIALDEGQIDINELTGGMLGQAAIYTDVQKQSHLYRKVSLRMQTWLNYVTK